MEQKEVSLDQLKKIHDLYVITVQILTQKCQFFAEEFQSVTELIEFHKSMAKANREKIEELEPPKKEAKDGEEGSN